METIFDFDDTEKRFNIDTITPGTPDWGLLWSKNLMMYEAYANFWQPRRVIAKRCMDYARGKIFTPGQRTKYEDVFKKIPIEPQEMIHVINALMTQITKMVQNSYITTEDETPPPNAASSEDMDTVLAWLKNELKIDQKKKKGLRNGLICGYPQCLWFDMVNSDDNMDKILKASILPWESTMPSFWFDEDDGTDIIELVRYSDKLQAELLEMFPERKKQLEKHKKFIAANDKGYFSQLLNLDQTSISEARKAVLYDQLNMAQFNSVEGVYRVIERNFIVKKIQHLQVNSETGDAQILPPEWTDARKAHWHNIHPEYDLEKAAPVRTLWTSTISSDGMIWENSEHWFQENGKLPAVFYIADMIDRVPMGVGEHMLPYILSIAVAETEGLHQVRAGTGTTTFAMEGTLKHPYALGTELAKPDGVVIVKKRAGDISKAIRQEVKKPNTTYLDFGDRSREQLARMHKANDAMMGVTHPRQSLVAKEKEIVQGMAPQSPYVENYSNFDNQITQMLCYLMPYGLTKERIVEIKDEFGRLKPPVQINVQEIDDSPQGSGKAEIIANDLTTVKYRVVVVPGEDTKTSREHQMKDFLEIIEAVGNTLFQMAPRLMAQFLKVFPNKFAQETGAFFEQHAQVAEQQQQQMAQAEQQADMQKEVMRRKTDLAKTMTPKFDIKLTPEEIQNAPVGAKLLLDLYERKQQENKAEMASA